jgi:hypothetical protein
MITYAFYLAYSAKIEDAKPGAPPMTRQRALKLGMSILRLFIKFQISIGVHIIEDGEPFKPLIIPIPKIVLPNFKFPNFPIAQQFAKGGGVAPGEALGMVDNQMVELQTLAFMQRATPTDPGMIGRPGKVVTEADMHEFLKSQPPQ